MRANWPEIALLFPGKESALSLHVFFFFSQFWTLGQHVIWSLDVFTLYCKKKNKQNIYNCVATFVFSWSHLQFFYILMLLSLNDNSVLTWRLQFFPCSSCLVKKSPRAFLEWKRPLINGTGSSLDKASVYQIHSKWTSRIFIASRVGYQAAESLPSVGRH